jgi:FAD/FMN-containing dehydrogenase
LFVPRSVEAAVEAVAVCAGSSIAPVLSRGGGTSLAGECCNTAVVLDWSKYCAALVSVDPTAADSASSRPGIVLDVLNRRLQPYGLEYGRSRPPTPPARSAG